MKKEKCFAHELIGEHIEITNSTNKTQLGLKGQVIDETKNTIKIKTNQGEKTILKSSIDFKIKSKEIIIKGNTIKKRTEDRLKG
jgi:ribonuclease P protein subunit POP4